MHVNITDRNLSVYEGMSSEKKHINVGNTACSVTGTLNRLSSVVYVIYMKNRLEALLVYTMKKVPILKCTDIDL